MKRNKITLIKIFFIRFFFFFFFFLQIRKAKNSWINIHGNEKKGGGRIRIKREGNTVET